MPVPPRLSWFFLFSFLFVQHLVPGTRYEGINISSSNETDCSNQFDLHYKQNMTASSESSTSTSGGGSGAGNAAQVRRLAKLLTTQHELRTKVRLGPQSMRLNNILLIA